MIKKLQRFQEELQHITYGKRKKLAQDKFYLLISQVSSLASREFTDRLEVCEKAVVEPIKEHLKKLGITDQKTLYDHMNYHFNCGEQYAQFLTFWDGQPCFDEKDLKEEAKEYFHFCMEYAEQFRPFVQRFGFHAWDISEGIHRIRESYTCGYMSEEAALHDIGIYVDRARHFFNNFRDYAMSYVCGAMYFMMRESRDEANVTKFGSMMLELCQSLLFEEGKNIWTTTSWLPDSIYFKHLEEVQNLPLKDGGLGCFVTDRVSVDDYMIGYFYREEGMEGKPDSGWRFFAGDEDKEYLDDLSHTHIFSLSTVASVFPGIIEWLDQPAGTAFALGKDGNYYKIDVAGTKDA